MNQKKSAGSPELNAFKILHLMRFNNESEEPREYYHDGNDRLL